MHWGGTQALFHHSMAVLALMLSKGPNDFILFTFGSHCLHCYSLFKSVHLTPPLLATVN
jgi:hypothetical protein